MASKDLSALVATKHQQILVLADQVVGLGRLGGGQELVIRGVAGDRGMVVNCTISAWAIKSSTSRKST